MPKCPDNTNCPSNSRCVQTNYNKFECRAQAPDKTTQPLGSVYGRGSIGVGPSATGSGKVGLGGVNITGSGSANPGITKSGRPAKIDISTGSGATGMQGLIEKFQSGDNKLVLLGIGGFIVLTVILVVARK